MSNPRHLRITHPSPWIVRFAPLVPQDAAGGRVLDLAAGGGRHSAVFLDGGHPVTAIDQTVEPLTQLHEEHPGMLEVIEADLEDGTDPFGAGGTLMGRTFAGIVVSNYLYRPLLPGLIAALAPGGILIYETFARGNETYNRPRNPDHLLKSGELLDVVRGTLDVIGYEHGQIEKDAAIAGVIQRICARRPTPSAREDNEPETLPVYPA